MSKKKKKAKCVQSDFSGWQAGDNPEQRPFFHNKPSREKEEEENFQG